MNKRLSVLVIAAKFPNIIQPWLANIVSATALKGIAVSVISLQLGDDVSVRSLVESGVNKKVTYLRLEGIWNLLSLLKGLSPSNFRYFVRGYARLDMSCRTYSSVIKKWIYKLSLSCISGSVNPDIIHSHSEPAGYKLLPLVSAVNAKFVITFHGLPPVGVKMLTKKERREYTDRADVILVNTEFAKKQYVGLGVGEEKIRIIPQGTDLSVFEFYERSDFDANGVLRLLCVGRLSADKGQKYVIEAMSYLIKDGVSAKLNIVGQGPDHELLKGQIKRLGLEDHVTILSGLSEAELVQKYQESDIFVLASTKSNDGYHEETQGVVIQEAQACGALVIATRVGGIPECVINNENGSLVGDRSSSEIYNKIKWLLENVNKWNEWRLNARRFVEERYDINVISNKICSLYEEIVRAEKQSHRFLS